jgi:hypothetical protein
MADARNRVLFWNTVYHPGELVVKGYQNGQQAAQYTLNTTGKATAIKATIYKEPQDKGAPIIPDSNCLQQIEVAITDDKGQKVSSAENAITVHVTGAATLKGIENSDANDVSDYHASTRKAKHGALIVYVQPTSPAGAYEVKLESPGMDPVVLKFN